MDWISHFCWSATLARKMSRQRVFSILNAIQRQIRATAVCLTLAASQCGDSERLLKGERFVSWILNGQHFGWVQSSPQSIQHRGWVAARHVCHRTANKDQIVQMNTSRETYDMIRYSQFTLKSILHISAVVPFKKYTHRFSIKSRKFKTLFVVVQRTPDNHDSFICQFVMSGRVFPHAKSQKKQQVRARFFWVAWKLQYVTQVGKHSLIQKF